MPLGKLIKCIFGVIVIIVLTSVLPFFDNLPWNMPGYQKRAVVRECMGKLVAHPAVTVSQLQDMSRDSKSADIDETLLKLNNIYPSPIAMLYGSMKRDARWRAWALLAVVKCSPRNATQSKYAPLLKPTIKMLKDPDPVVAANALNVLQSYSELPPDYFAQGGAWFGKKLEKPSEWFDVYDHWFRKDNPEWHQINCRYYCDRNWPKAME